jgi:cell division protein FtsI (penicillin-binding protein 3)
MEEDQLDHDLVRPWRVDDAVADGGGRRGADEWRQADPADLPAALEEEADAVAKTVLKPTTSEAMRYLFRLNAEKGSGRRAKVEGYDVGGKTGTAEKVVNGRYSNDKRFNAFLAAFPMDDPQYVVLTIIDEPKPEEGMHSATAGLNAAPMVQRIISRAAPLLGLTPEFGMAMMPCSCRIDG